MPCACITLSTESRCLRKKPVTMPTCHTVWAFGCTRDHRRSHKAICPNVHEAIPTITKVSLSSAEHFLAAQSRARSAPKADRRLQTNESGAVAPSARPALPSGHKHAHRALRERAVCTRSDCRRAATQVERYQHRGTLRSKSFITSDSATLSNSNAEGVSVPNASRRDNERLKTYSRLVETGTASLPVPCANDARSLTANLPSPHASVSTPLGLLTGSTR
eukprot:126790-Pleurochrysis_carterae.AAC.7